MYTFVYLRPVFHHLAKTCPELNFFSMSHTFIIFFKYKLLYTLDNVQTEFDTIWRDKTNRTPRTRFIGDTARRRTWTKIILAWGSQYIDRPDRTLPGLQLNMALFCLVSAVHCWKNQYKLEVKSKKKRLFSFRFDKNDLFQIYFTYYLQYLVFNVQLNYFFTVYHFTLAGLLLPTRRRYTFVSLLDLLITRQPRKILQRNCTTIIPAPQA